MGRAVPVVIELTVTHFVEAAAGQTGGNVCHEIHPHGHLRAVEGRLLDDALRTVGHVAHNDLVSLVGCIAEEIAFEHGLRFARQLLEQFCIGRHDSFQLRLERDQGAAGMNHGMIFFHFGAGVETKYLGAGVLIVDLFGPFFHSNCFFGCKDTIFCGITDDFL